MEKYVTVKSIDWPTVVEFFTKRGKPLTKEDEEALLLQDKEAEQTY